MSCRPVDYALIYRLEDERFAREKAYICPFWDWIQDFADHFRAEAWWNRIPKEGFNGSVWPAGLGFWAHAVQGHVSGEIDCR